ncbi:MAG: hypothetical protein PHW33_02075 [Candidatus Portnoybacteria bacterium]|nr:hypothetical protein [Candidatus Portnoybacteria bacterium]
MEGKAEERIFLGKDDPEAVVVFQPFANSPIVISSGINLHRDKNGIAVQGPQEHLKFLYPKLATLLLAGAGANEYSGRWIGLDWFNEEWLSFYYLFGKNFSDIFELLECKLRRDLVFFCGLRLNEEAELVVRSRNQIVLRINKLGLPEDISENGYLEFPEPAILPAKSFLAS